MTSEQYSLDTVREATVQCAQAVAVLVEREGHGELAARGDGAADQLDVRRLLHIDGEDREGVRTRLRTGHISIVCRFGHCYDSLR